MDQIKNCPICKSKKIDLWMQTQDFFLTGEDFQISICNECGFKFTNPRPDIKNLGGYYKSDAYISHSNSNKGLINGIYQFVRQYTLAKKYQQITNYKKSGKMLDIGCATGEFLNFHKDKGFEVVGVEPDQDARKQAEENYNIQVFDEEFLNQAEENSFDVISMWHVLEHVPDLELRVQQLSRLLKPDGLLIIAVPNINSWDAKKYGRHWAALDVPRHLYHFNQENIKQLFEQHSFELHKTKPMPFDSFYVSILSEKYKCTSLQLIRAFVTGFVSNIKANAKGNEFSSLTYYFKKK
ncbi:MAG: methyltransferase domain-containing protein [Bacteroidales bacterium]